MLLVGNISEGVYSLEAEYNKPYLPNCEFYKISHLNYLIHLYNRYLYNYS